MNKKLLAVAVAGALAAPGVALAQASSVTISGFFKVGYEQQTLSGSPSTVTSGRLNSSQMRIVDNSSRLIFNVNEALGNGLEAVAQLDIRFAPDQAASIQTANSLGSGNTWVGLKSAKYGRLTMGRHDLHYGSSPDDTAAKAGALEAANISLFDYINGTAIANGTRTQNVMRYDTPTWNGFDGTVAWSASPVGGTELDQIMISPTTTGNAQAVTATPIPGTVALGAAGATAPILGPGGTTTRKGDGWNVKLQYTAPVWQVGYSYWNAKPDAPGPTTNDQLGQTLWGYYKWGGFKVGLGYNESELRNSNGFNVAATGTSKAAKRDAWTIPMSYVWGPHNIVGHYTQANNNTALINSSNTGAKMYAMAYVYDMSKRTSVGLTYAKINNGANASYNFFTGSALGSLDTVVVGGESPRLIQATIKHAF